MVMHCVDIDFYRYAGDFDDGSALPPHVMARRKPLHQAPKMAHAGMPSARRRNEIAVLS